MNTLSFEKTIDETRGVVKSYFTRQKDHTNKTREIQANYKGDMQKTELERLGVPPDVNTAISHLHALRDSALLDITVERSHLREAKYLSPDWQFLSLPLSLPPDMIQALHDRNVYDGLLCEALQQYCINKGIDVFINGLNLVCYLDEQEKALIDFFKSEESTLFHNVVDTHEIAESMGFYDNAKAVLAGWESYKTYAKPDIPVVKVAPDEDGQGDESEEVENGTDDL